MPVPEGKSEKRPNAVDVQVGLLMRERRKKLRLTQEYLGNLLGVTFQQVQKYEKGINRISASRLQDIARILKVELSYFFPNKPPPETAPKPLSKKFSTDYPIKHKLAEPKVKPLVRKQSSSSLNDDKIQLLSFFEKINNPEIRKQIISLTKSLSETKN